MTNNEHTSDGTIREKDIFGMGEDAERAQVSRGDHLLRALDLYVLAPFRIVWSDWRARIGGVGVLFYLLMGTVGVVIVPQPELNEGPRYLGAFVDPSIPLGTDNVGRSIGKQIVHATPAMLKMALAGALFSVTVAVVIGFLAGYKGGLVDSVLMTVTDIQVTIPGLPLIIIIAAVYPPSDPFVVGIILSIDAWPGLARSLRSQVLTLREEEFIEAARSMGLPTTTIIRQELTPKLAPYILVNAAGSATSVIKASVALYFLNILPFSTLNWGVMMNFAYSQGNALSNVSTAGHWLFFPALALSGLTFSLVLLSQGLDRIFNPRLRARHANTTPDDTEIQ